MAVGSEISTNMSDHELHTGSHREFNEAGAHSENEAFLCKSFRVVFVSCCVKHN